MHAAIDGIRLAAYARWQHRDRLHGYDRVDWLAAEKQLRFARTYRVAAADRLDADSPRVIGSPTHRRCRFCDHSPPRANFASSVPMFPREFGPSPPIAFDQCNDCITQFASGIDEALGRFIGLREDGRVSIPVDAFKGLTKLALAVMPAAELDEHEETIDWVGNPDHDFDLNVFRGLACILHTAPRPFPASWSALARRESDDEAFPSTLYFLGIGRSTYEIAVPLGQRDDDLDVPLAARPDVLPPCPFGLDFDPIARRILPIASVGRERSSSKLMLSVAAP